MIVHSIRKEAEEQVASVTPDQLVAQKIGDALVAAGLIEATKKDATVAKLALGKMKGADWKILLDLSKPKGGQ